MKRFYSKKKTIFSLLLVLALILVPVIDFCHSVFATSTGEHVIKLTVSAPTFLPKKDKSFTVEVKLSNNSSKGFNAVDMTLAYDKEAMQCTSCKVGSILSGALSATNPDGKNGAILSAAIMSSVTKNGTIFEVTFTALKDLTEYSMELINLQISDFDGNEYKVEITYPKKQSAVEEKEETKTESEEEEKTNSDSSETGFADVQKGYWGESYINESVEQGLFNGYGDGNFGPEDNITRAQFVTVLWRLSGSPEPTKKSTFKDISGQLEEFQKAIHWGYEKGIINGRSTTVFDPDGYITRQEVMKILFYYNGAKTGGESGYASIYKVNFTDYYQIGDWAVPAVNWSIYNKIVNGTSDTTISPLGYASRAQVAKILVTYDNTFNTR